MARQPYSGELEGYLVPATVIVSDGRIISIRPNAATGTARVDWDPDQGKSSVIIAGGHPLPRPQDT